MAEKENFPLGYLLSDLKNGSCHIIINSYYTGMDVKSDIFKRMYKHINNTLLEEKIHLDFGVVGRNLGHDVMMDSMSKVVPGKSLMLKVDGPMSFFPYFNNSKFDLFGYISGNKDDIEQRLNKSFRKMGGQ
jgi:hypothetical protein